jgi:hypothetical protein
VSNKILKSAGITLILVLSIVPAVFGGFQEDLWQKSKSDHFTVFYKAETSEAYVQELLKYAEDYYTGITEELGFRRFDFWTWENTCKIYLFASRKDYTELSSQPGWTGGAAYVRQRMILTFVNQGDFLNTILPHEMTHLIFREFVGYRTNLPLWVDEGIACLEEKQNRKQYLGVARVLVKSHVFIPLDKLTEIRQEGLLMPEVFYAESASVVQFLLQKYGQEKFVDYCRRLRDNKDWKHSLLEVYGVKSLSELNVLWKDFLAGKK